MISMYNKIFEIYDDRFIIEINYFGYIYRILNQIPDSKINDFTVEVIRMHNRPTIFF